MRQILFRAKRKDNGEWVEGNFIHRTSYYGGDVDDYFILEGGEFDFEHEVIPETICQYTGLTDKNGNRIWENDIVRTKFFGKDDGKGHNFSDYDNFVVKWNNSGFALENENRIFPFYGGDKSKKVIGNVFDNPDLLEDKE